MFPEVLGIIGLGTLGGSVAWRAKHLGVNRVLGYCFSPRDGVAAAKSGAISELATDVRRVVTQSEFVVLATTPKRTLELLDRLATMTMRGAYLTDTAPVKGPIIERAAQLGLARWFAGSHPLMHGQYGGFEAARHDQLAGSLVYVTPVFDSDGAAREVADFWDRVVGAQSVLLDAGTHDRIVAQTSHLPRVVAATLAAALKRHGPKGVTYGAEALTNTQLARADTDLWSDVLMMNRAFVLEALNGLEGELGLLRKALDERDLASLRGWLEQAREWRDGVDA